ncbi:MAG: 3-oxo-tetronate kinase, partial [Pseudomonadota bacterium]
MILGVIADDFTGASDIANTLAKQGMQTALYCTSPRAPAEPTVEAGVVALKCRTAPVETAMLSALETLEWLLDQGARQFVYKVCSTFDSTDTGNIGPVTEALADRLGAGAVPVCPAFPATGRRVFMGHLFVGDRLLSETGMATHPLTPMTDPDLRRVLARQSRRQVSWIGLDRVRADGLAAALAAEDGHLVLLDAIEDEDLRRIGAATAKHVLLTGGSGIALGLPALHLGTPAHCAAQAWRGAPGPVVALAGSVSQATQGQIAAHESAGEPVLRVAPAAVLDGSVDAAVLADWVMARQDGVPLVASADTAEAVAAAQARFGKARVAAAIEELLSDTATLLAARGVTRFICAGGLAACA